MRRKDKLANMQRVNKLFESRVNEGLPLKGVSGQGFGDTPSHAPKNHLPLKSVGGQEGDATPKNHLPLKQNVKEAPKFGGQEVSQDQYDELQWDKQNLEKASMDAFKTPEGYSTNAQVGETYDTKEGDRVKVLNIDDKGNHQVYLEFGPESIAWNKRHGIPTPKPFKITWSGVQFTTIVGEIDDYDDSQYHGETHGY